MTHELDVLVVGAGFNGLYQLHALRREGFDVQLVEAQNGLGGVWNNNCYPGARVDSHVPNYEFSLEEIWRDWDWSERFPGWEELQAYFRHVSDALDLERDISLNTRVTAAAFDEDSRCWDVTTENTLDQSEQIFRPRYLIVCTGFASKPHIPDLPGLDRFEGDVHHTARWPHSATHAESLQPLVDKRVAVIGTGASGVQVVQEGSKVARHLTAMQRTPVTAIPMVQRQFTSAEQVEHKTNLADLFRIRNSPPGSMTDIMRISKRAHEVPEAERLAVFDEAWAKGGFHFWVGTYFDVGSDERSNRLAYDYWRDRTRERIDDPAVAEILAPTEPRYPFGTKRPSLEQDYYDVFNRDNVSLVDLSADPIVEITATSIRTGDQEVAVDVIVLATGFDANTGGLTQIDIRGTDGQSLAERWTGEIRTHTGVAVDRFPNLLFLYGPQSPTAFCNGPTCAELQGEWVVEFLDQLRSEGHSRFESTSAAADEWTDHLSEVAEGSLLSKADSWYMAANIPGKTRQLLNYPNSDAYLQRLGQIAADGYAGFKLSY